MPLVDDRCLDFGAGLFFDRDGTLMRDTGYISDIAKVELLPGVREALRRLRRKCRIFLFTNQSGIARGYFSLEDVNRINRELSRQICGHDEFFDGICIAPEHPDEPHIYRKPSPRYILEMIDRFHLDASHCAMFGDRASDLLAAANAQIRGVRITANFDDEQAAIVAKKHGFDSLASIADFEPFPDK